MKKLYWLLTLAVAGTACQHQAPPTQVAVATSTAALTTTTLVKTIAVPAPIVADSLTPRTRATLRRVDLSSLLLAPQPGKTGEYQSALDGFFGKNPQRLSLAIVKATRDSLQPSIYHIIGKTRYEKQIANFEGSIQLTKLADYYDQGILLVQQEATFLQDTITGKGNIVNAKAYSATASFNFTNSSLPNSYLLAGQALLDFWVTDGGKTGIIYPAFAGLILDKTPTKGSGLLLKGTWRNGTTNLQNPFLVSRNIFLLSPDIIQEFGIGDRGSEVNPKYAKLGWNTYWENDEWWADSPKPALGL